MGLCSLTAAAQLCHWTHAAAGPSRHPAHACLVPGLLHPYVCTRRATALPSACVIQVGGDTLGSVSSLPPPLRCCGWAWAGSSRPRNKSGLSSGVAGTRPSRRRTSGARNGGRRRPTPPSPPCLRSCTSRLSAWTQARFICPPCHTTFCWFRFTHGGVVVEIDILDKLMYNTPHRHMELFAYTSFYIMRMIIFCLCDVYLLYV